MVQKLRFSAFLADAKTADRGGGKTIWLPDSHWSAFAYPGHSVQWRLIVRNLGRRPAFLDGELRWESRTSAAVVGVGGNQVIWRNRIAKTRIGSHLGVVIDVTLPARRVGSYKLVWHHGAVDRDIANLTCIYRPGGLRTPVLQSHWISPIPDLPPGTPGRHFARRVADLVALTGVKRYWLTLTTGDPINSRQRLFAAALRAAGGQLLLRIIYPITPADIGRLSYPATSRWLKSAMTALAQPAFVEPIFIGQPSRLGHGLPLIKSLVASDAAIASTGHAGLLLSTRWYSILSPTLRAAVRGLVVCEASNFCRRSPEPKFSRASLPTWCLPVLLQRPTSNFAAARNLRSPATVVAVAPPWNSADGGWLVHTLGAAVWLQNLTLPRWGRAALLQAHHRSMAIISRIRGRDRAHIRGVATLWLPNRLVGRDIFKDMRLRRYDESSYIQFMDPDGAISVFDLRGRPIIPLYPGLPRVSALNSEAMLISTESAASLLAAVRTAVVRKEPHIVSIRRLHSSFRSSALDNNPQPAEGIAGASQWIRVTIEGRSTELGKMQIAEVGRKNRYQLIVPTRLSMHSRQREMILEIHLPAHAKKLIIALRGQRRTWLAAIKLTTPALK